jgi:hypothetical protein
MAVPASALVFLGVTSLISCSDSGTPNPINTVYLDAPKVTSFVFTDETGNTLGYWGLPPEKSLLSVFSYPNPLNPTATIRFQLPQATHLQVWVVKALGPGESEGDLIDYFEAGCVKPDGVPLDVLCDGYFQAGVVEFEWDASAYPDGFYCYYVATDYHPLERWFMLLWTDHSGIPFDYLFDDRPGI